MSFFRCTCRHEWSDISDRYDGSIFWWDRDDRGETILVKDLWAFAQACASGQRSEWIASYFERDVSGSLSDAEVAELIYHQLGRRFRSHVFRCPACGRITIDDPENPRELRSYAPDPPPAKSETGAAAQTATLFVDASGAVHPSAAEER